MSDICTVFRLLSLLKFVTGRADCVLVFPLLGFCFERAREIVISFFFSCPLILVPVLDPRIFPTRCSLWQLTEATSRLSKCSWTQASAQTLSHLHGSRASTTVRIRLHSRVLTATTTWTSYACSSLLALKQIQGIIVHPLL